MINYEFYNPARIIFGRVEESSITYIIKKNGGSRILLHYGQSSIKKCGLYDKVVSALNEAGLFFKELGGVEPNPKLSLIREGTDICHQNNINFILAVGGGSVIDSAKAIAAAVKNEGEIWDYYLDSSKEIKDAIPIGVILTIPAAGSESSDGSVVTNEQTGLKRFINSSLLIPKFAILNPEYTFTLSAYQTACGSYDILSHLMERYFTNVKNTDLTDRLIEGSAKVIINNTPVAIEEPYNYNVRAEIVQTGTLAHNNLLNCGRIGDWGSHMIEHELSGLNDIAHGAGLSIVTPAWMKYVYKNNVSRFVQFAIRVFDMDYAMTDLNAIVLEMINRLEKWSKEIGLPIRLSEVGISAESIELMAEKCLIGRNHVGNLKELYKEDIINVLKLAF